MVPMSGRQNSIIYLIWLVLFLGCCCNNYYHVKGFYLPGVQPRNFLEGEQITLKANKLTSFQTQWPIDPYSLPFCSPYYGPRMDSQNLGEFLSGNRIQSTPFEIYMKQDLFCQQLCIANMEGENHNHNDNVNKNVDQVIRNGYRHNWIVDNLPAMSIVQTPDVLVTSMIDGFPIGFIDNINNKNSQNDDKDVDDNDDDVEDVDDNDDDNTIDVDDNDDDNTIAFIYNHFNIELEYHPTQGTDNDHHYRVVRFAVRLFSIAHDFTPITDENENDNDNYFYSMTTRPAVANIQNPIASCNPDIPANLKNHTDYDMITHHGILPQPAVGDVLFTYDVTWSLNDNVHWATRWDIYLSMDNAIPAKIHWVSIFNSLFWLSLLGVIIISVVVRNIRQDLSKYNNLVPDDEIVDDIVDNLGEKGWRLLHADVFRTPQHPMMLSVLCGTGAQLLVSMLLVICFCALGVFNPARRGSLLTGIIVLYNVMGGIGGYVTIRIYRTLLKKEQTSHFRATLLTAMTFPGLCFVCFELMNIMAATQTENVHVGYKSTLAVPYVTHLVLLFLWFFICTPLTFCGASIAKWRGPIDFPVKTSSVPRTVPSQPWYLKNAFFTFILSGILPLGCCFTEFYFIMHSLWAGHYYYVFGFLLLVFWLVIFTCAEISLISTYCQLYHEDYHWWWRSFGISSGIGFYIFLYSVFCYFGRLEATSSIFSSTGLFYIGYIGLVSVGLGLMTGCVGLLTSLWFNIFIYGCLKMD